MAEKAKVFRCRICADPYIGIEPPSRCPFCGAKAEYIIEAADWNPEEFNVDLSEKSRSNLEAALEIEISNTGFYIAAMEKAKEKGDDYSLAKFKALKKIEAEHASAISKFLKIEKKAFPEITCSDSALENTKEGFEREQRAIKLYGQFKNEATEPRIKEFFNALMEVEVDHLNIHEKSL